MHRCRRDFLKTTALLGAGAGATLEFWASSVARAAASPVIGSQSYDIGAIRSPIVFRGDATTAYRDPAAIYHEGGFRLFFTLVEIEPDQRVFSYCAWSKSRDLVHWSKPEVLTPRDQNLNFGSPGNIIRFGDEWVLCLQTYPRPNGERYGNADARIWTVRSKNLETWGAPELLRVKGPDVPREKMGRMIDPYLIEDKDEPGKWWCFYKTGAAWSHDLRVWTPDPQRPPGENPCVILDESDYVMFFSPHNGVGVRRSKNLKDWRDDGLLMLGQDNWPWTRGRLTAGFVLDLRREPAVSKALMFFHGSDFPEGDPRGGFDNFASIGMAWSTDLKNWNWPGKSVKGAKADAATSPSRHLLLDDRVVASAENARLSVGTVRKHPGNPLFGEDKPWEQRFDNLYANIIYEETGGLYQCWYSPFIVDRSSKGMTLKQRNQTPYRAPRNREMGVCYAVSRDGLVWEKPELNLVEFEGGKKNNLVLRGPHGAGVFKDPHDSEPLRRHKMFHAGDVLRFSADALHWSEPVPCPGIQSKGDTHNNLLWAPELQRYVGFVRLREGDQRIVGRTESADRKQWTKAVEVLRCNAQNQAYSMPVFRYADIYLGLVAVFRTREDRVHTELAWSPDTITWHRIQPGTPFIGNLPNEGDYDWGCVYAADAPVVLDDEIRIYYGGSNGKHTGWRDGFLCLATLRPDGWAGYEQVERSKPAVVTTREIPCGSRPIRVTADVKLGGSVKISIVDASGNQLIAAKPLTETVTDAELHWDRKIEVDSIRLRFELSGAKLYSFSFGSPAPSRNSRRKPDNAFELKEATPHQ